MLYAGLIPLLALSTPSAGPLAVGGFAPDIALEDWIEPGGDGVVRSFEGSGEMPEEARRAMEGLGPGEGDRLAGLHGWVVVIHPIDRERATRDSELLTLLRDLAEANEDRALALLGLAPAGDEEEVREELGRLGVDWPVGLAGGEAASPYFGGDASFVIGPNRALLFAGEAVGDQKGFLAAIQLAFNRPTAPRVERALAPALDEAWSLYVSGELAMAAKAAERVEKKARRSGATAATNDAAELAQLVTKARTEWIAAVRTALARLDGKRFVRGTRDVERAFPRGEAREELDEIEREARQFGGFENALRDNELWFDAAPDRPPLFPLRQSRAGDRYAKQLEKLVKATNNSLDVTRTAQRMLRKYRGEGS